MVKINSLRKHAEIFFALSDETRLSLVQKLIDAGETSISELTHGFPMSRQAATRHIKVLEDVGIIRQKKIGRENRLTIDMKPLDEALDLLESVERRWDQRLSRLKIFAENTE